MIKLLFIIPIITGIAFIYKLSKYKYKKTLKEVYDILDGIDKDDKNKNKGKIFSY